MRDHRVLVIAERLPLPVRGGTDLRILGIVKAAAQFARVGVLAISPRSAVVPDYVDLWTASAPEIPETSTLVRQALTTPTDPFAPYADPQRVAVFRSAIDAFDPTVIVCHRLRAWRILAEAIADRPIPCVLDLDEASVRSTRVLEVVGDHDAGTKVRRLFYRSLATYERMAAEQAEQTWLSADIDAAEITTAVPGARVVVVPNVVDVDDYRCAPPIGGRRGLVFTGSFSYPPNEDAARVLLDEIAPRLPDREFLLAGSYLPQWIRDRAGGNVRVEGPIERMDEVLASAAVLLVPLRVGTGTRLKVLEALAASLPVISTQIGVEDLGLEAGRHYLPAETTEDFVAAVHRLEADPALARFLAQEGLVRVRECHSVQFLATILARALADVGTHREVPTR